MQNLVFSFFPRGQPGLAGRGHVDIMHPDVGPWPLSRFVSPPGEGKGLINSAVGCRDRMVAFGAAVF